VAAGWYGREDRLTYSHNVTITIVQVLAVPMEVPFAAEICGPPLGRFGDHRPRIFGERMERREPVCEREEYQKTPIRYKRQWNGPSNVIRNGQGKQRWKNDEKNDKR
jgi:hypothetical protein